MRLRVVCGFRVTMASFSPTRAFSSVDLPALGRPMIETNPERKAISGPDLFRCGCGLESNTHAVYSAFGRLKDLELQSILLKNFAGSRNVPGEFAHQARDGGRFLVI